MKNLWIQKINRNSKKIGILVFLFIFLGSSLGLPFYMAHAQEMPTVVTPLNSTPFEANLPDSTIPGNGSENLGTDPEQVEPGQDLSSVDKPVTEEEQPKDKEPKDKEDKKEDKKDSIIEAPNEEAKAQPEALAALAPPQPTQLKFELPTQTSATVDQSTGALNYGYSFDLPEGRAGMTPELSLKYNSRGLSDLDSIVGLGWELSIPYIKREPVKGTQNLYNKAYFSSSLSGNLISTTDTTSSQYTVYRNEVDNGDYQKYTYNSDNTWTLTAKDGRTFTFGEVSNSRQDNPGDSSKVYKWMLSKIVDTHGNEIQFSYTKDNGQIYPNQILYTYHASSPAVHIVNFTYTTPANYGSTTYKAAFPIITYKLLNTVSITTTIDAQTTSKTYTLNYSDAQFLKQKLLTSVTKTNNIAGYEYSQSFDDTTSFTYSNKTPGWEAGTHSLQGYIVDADNSGSIYRDMAIMDFDNNGYDDILVSNYAVNNLYKYLLLNNGTSYTDVTSSWNLPPDNTNVYYAVVDVNGDKLPDFHPRWYNDQPSQANVFLNTGSGFIEDTSDKWVMKDYIPEATCGPNASDSMSMLINTFLTDMNGDGKNDIVWFGGTGSNRFKVALNNGNGWTVSNDYTFTAAPGANFTIEPQCGGTPNNTYQTLLDFNGDGLLDYYHEVHGVYLNTGSGFAYNSAYFITTNEMNRSGLADINGDGLIDYISYKALGGGNVCSVVYLNDGNGLVMTNPTSIPPCTMNAMWDPAELNYVSGNYIGSLLDITADGLPDIYGRSTSNGNYGRIRAINDGKSSWVTTPTGGSNLWNPLIDPAAAKFLDINADGILDWVTASTSWDGSSSFASKAYMGKQSIPNRLTKITTPLGAETAVEYSTAKTNGNDLSSSPIPVVSKISVKNIGFNQPDMVTKYDYSKGAYVSDSATKQKRFAGFQKVTTTESASDLVPLRVSETYFHQANGSDGATNEPADTDLAKIGKVYYSVVRSPDSVTKKESWNKYDTYTLTTEPVIGRVSKFIYPTESVTKTTDASGSVGDAVVYTFDTALGEQTEQRNLGAVTVSSNGSYTDISGDTKYQFTEYAADSGATFVKPKRQDLRTGSAANTTVSRTDYYYDSQSYGVIGTLGDLTKETSWISGDGVVTADTVYAYDSFGNITSITNPRSALTTFTYDSSKSLLASQTNHLNQTTSYEYITGMLKKITDPNGRTTTITYSSIGLPYKTTEANTAGSRIKTQWVERDQGQLWALMSTDLPVKTGSPQYSWVAVDQLGREIRKAVWDLDFDAATNIGWFLKETKNYDALGRNTTISAPYGTPTANGDWFGHMNTSVPSNLISTTIYDVFDRPLAVTNALGTTTNVYAGNQVTTTDANGHQKKTKTDAYGNLVEVKEYNSSSEYVTNYTYDIRNLLTSITDALGNVRNFSYDNAGWITNSEDLHAAADSSFGSYSYTYDLNGNPLVETQPNGVTVTKVYDMLDRMTSADGSSTPGVDYTYTYDSCTNGKGRVCTVAGTLPNSVTLNKSYVYGISGTPTSVSMTTLGNTYITAYEYTLGDEVKKITYPNGTIVRYAFGDWALPSKVYTTLPGQTETLDATVTYHHTGKPLVTTVINGPTTIYTYDDTKLYRMTRKLSATSGTQSVVATIYPTAGDGYISHNHSKWSTVRNASVGTTATYTASNAEVGAGQNSSGNYSLLRSFLPFDTSSIPDNATITSARLKVYVNSKQNSDNDGYDWISVFQGTQNSANTLITDDYDQLNSGEGIDAAERKDITAITTGGYTSFELNATGKSWINLTGSTKLGFKEGHDVMNHTIDVTTNNYNKINYATSEASGTSNDPILEVNYTSPVTTVFQDYNYTYDNVNNITQITELGVTKNYVYDDLNRLTQATHTPTSGSPTTFNYAYNAIGNITSMNGQSYTYSGTGKTNPHAVTSVGSNNYTYDDNGNIATSPNKAFTYNWQNQMQAVIVNGTTTINSSYDESGQRFLYQTPTTTEIAVTDGYLLRGSTPEINISIAGIPLGVISGTNKYASISDHLGSPVKQFNSSGILMEDTSYDPYGGVLSHTGTFDAKDGYTGHQEDVDTGLVYANARYYDPSIGRFMGQDMFAKKYPYKALSDPQQLNYYSYGRNNPIFYTDPTGNCVDGITTLGCIAAWTFLGTIGTGIVLELYGAITGKGDVIETGQHLRQTSEIGGSGLIQSRGGTNPITGQRGMEFKIGEGLNGNTTSKISVGGKVGESNELSLRGPQNLDYSSHAKKQMLKRNVDTSQVQSTVSVAEPFNYYHENQLKVGYRDPATKIFVATPVNKPNRIITVITNTRNGYQGNLEVKSQPSYSQNITIKVK